MAGTSWGQVHAASTPSSSALVTELCIFHLSTRPISPVLTGPQGALARSLSYGTWMIRDSQLQPGRAPRAAVPHRGGGGGGCRRAFRSTGADAQMLMDLLWTRSPPQAPHPHSRRAPLPSGYRLALLGAGSLTKAEMECWDAHTGLEVRAQSSAVVPLPGCQPGSQGVLGGGHFWATRTETTRWGAGSWKEMKPLGICAGSLGPPLTSDHKLGAQSSRNAFSQVPEARSPRSRRPQGCVPSGSCGGRRGPSCLFQLLGSPGGDGEGKWAESPGSSDDAA